MTKKKEVKKTDTIQKQLKSLNCGQIKCLAKQFGKTEKEMNIILGKASKKKNIEKIFIKS